MKALKPIISITLLFAYLLSFGHTLTPHCESNCDGAEVTNHVHQHEHHHGIEETNLEHDDHVAHGDHYDEGWIDYLACLFSDVEHHDNTCHTDLLLEQENVQFKNSKSVDADKIQTPAFAIFVSHELISEKLVAASILVNGPPLDFERQCYLSSFSLRGPPFYSC